MTFRSHLGPSGNFVVHVTRIHQNAQPHDLRPKMGGDAIQFVLEINGGMARQLGIAEGSQMRHPSVDPDLAAWPC